MWNDADLPLAHLIVFRCYGTWLHGDERGSTDRRQNIFRSPHIPANERWQQHNQRALKFTAVSLNVEQRQSVHKAIGETCTYRGWHLYAFNIRTNHVHIVVSIGATRPSRALNAFKANALGKCGKMETGSALIVLGPTKGASAICGMNAALG